MCFCFFSSKRGRNTKPVDLKATKSSSLCRKDKNECRASSRPAPESPTRMSTVKSKMQNRLSRRCRPQAQTSKTSKRRSIPNSKISHLTELRKAVHIAGAVVSLPPCRPSPAPPPPPSVLGACSIVSLLLPEVGEARGGYDPRDVGRGHDFAVPNSEGDRACMQPGFDLNNQTACFRKCRPKPRGYEFCICFPHSW